ncbi:MAG: agmatinase family protein [Deltaproteobacteria bacterium]|nr:MAG: agmatinase family protein [Deltaproteobacteria bacterium]
MDFDPDGPASGGLFGLPHTPDNARVVVLPVPVECTTSSAGGTSSGPDAVLEASWQVDLCDPQTGEPWREGIAMVDAPEGLADEDAACRELSEAAREGDADALARIDALGERTVALTEAFTGEQLDAGRIPAILGGDHSVPLGAFRAAVARHPGLGILHIDAHADLRDAYEGFTYSHASIFFNALKLEQLSTLVQVGIRDYGTRELALATAEPRVHQWTDHAMAAHAHGGGTFRQLCERIVAPLPDVVWVSWDIDGLDPALCPGTGTPVPGGLSWREAMTLLEVLGQSGRTIVGFDLCEVGPGSWDANVGARLLYKLSGWAIASQRKA